MSRSLLDRQFVSCGKYISWEYRCGCVRVEDDLGFFQEKADRAIDVNHVQKLQTSFEFGICRFTFGRPPQYHNIGEPVQESPQCIRDTLTSFP